MSQLAVGDRVQSLDPSTGQLTYSEVLLFLDRSPTQERTFVTLTTESGAQLTVTAGHLVQVSSTGDDKDSFRSSYAGAVEAGHYLLRHQTAGGGGDFTADRVIGVSVSRRTGVYAPLTYAGNLVVDRVVASSYAVIDSQALAHAAFAPVRWWSLFKANVKQFWKSVSFRFASSEGKDELARTRVRYTPPDGVHWYASMLYRVAGWILPSHLLVPAS